MKQVNYGPKFEEEIAQLEQKLAQKKQEAIQAGENRAEKEIISETLQEHIAQAENQSTSENLIVSSSPANDTQQAPHQASHDLGSEETKHYLEALLAHAFDKGILSAVKEARKTNDPYLVDKLHDELVDHFYQQLLNSKQITQE